MNEYFRGYIRISCLSVCTSVYIILVIWYRELLQFCFKCIKTLLIHLSHFLSIFLLPVSAKALAGGGGGGVSKSHSVTALVSKVKETAKFDVCGMRSIPVAWNDFVDRSARCSRPQNYKFVHFRERKS